MDDGVLVDVGQPRAKTVVAALEEMMEATGGNVAVRLCLDAREGLFAGPGYQYVSDEADCALAVATRAPASARDWRIVGAVQDKNLGFVLDSGQSRHTLFGCSKVNWIQETASYTKSLFTYIAPEFWELDYKRASINLRKYFEHHIADMTGIIACSLPEISLVAFSTAFDWPKGRHARSLW